MAGVRHTGMRRNRLEASVEQCGVHAIAGLLFADHAGQPNFCQHGAAGFLGGVCGGQAGESGSVLDTALVQRASKFGARYRARMRRQQGLDVVRGWLVLVASGGQNRGGAPRVLAIPIRLHREREGAWCLRGCDEADLGFVIEKQHLLEADVADFGGIAEDGAGGDQCHLAVRSTRQGGRTVYHVIGQPRQRVGADVGLPNVPLGFLGQAHMRAHQRMHRDAGAG